MIEKRDICDFIVHPKLEFFFDNIIREKWTFFVDSVRKYGNPVITAEQMTKTNNTPGRVIVRLLA